MYCQNTEILSYQELHYIRNFFYSKKFILDIRHIEIHILGIGEFFPETRMFFLKQKK